MIRITENTLHITIPHPCPEEALDELRNGIIESLQLQYEHPKNIGALTKEENNENYMLLELLKATFKRGNSDKMEIRYLDKKQATEIAELLQGLLEILLPEKD